MLTAIAFAAVMGRLPLQQPLAAGQTPAKAAPAPPKPILWLTSEGKVLVNGEEFSPEVNGGASALPTQYGTAFDFAGEKSGLLFGDQKAFELTGDMTISAWLYPRNYAPNGNQSEVLFRGDDRNGWDPFALLVTANGDVHFVIENDKNEGAEVTARIKLGRWSHVTATLSVSAGEMKIYVNGMRYDTLKTDKRPFSKLDPKYTPGVGVGNVQNNKGPHNQPFNGMIQDLRLYDKVVTPQYAGFDHIRDVSSP